MAEHVNQASFSGNIDTKRAPFFSSKADAKVAFARFRVIQYYANVDAQGQEHQGFNQQDVKVFGAAHVETLKKLFERAKADEDVAVLVTGRLTSEQDKSTSSVYTAKDGSEKRGKIFERVLIVDEKIEAHSLVEFVDAPPRKTQQKAA